MDTEERFKTGGVASAPLAVSLAAYSEVTVAIDDGRATFKIDPKAKWVGWRVVSDSVVPMFTAKDGRRWDGEPVPITRS